MRISETAEHNRGLTVARNDFENAYENLEATLTGLAPTMRSTLPNRADSHKRNFPIAQARLNDDIAAGLDAEWEPKPPTTLTWTPLGGRRNTYSPEVDFAHPKTRPDGDPIEVAMEVEFGNVGSLFRDFVKLRQMKTQGTDLAILVTPSQRLKEMIDNATESFDFAYGLMTLDQPPLPFVLIELDLTDGEWDTTWDAWVAKFGHEIGIKRP